MARLGVDLVDIARIDRLKERPRFLQRVFTTRELDYFKAHSMSSQTIAGSFAAKEATSKLLKTGIGPIAFKDMEVLRGDRGQPYLVLSDKGQALARSKGIEGVEISISHEKSYAIAVASQGGFMTSREKCPIALKEREPHSHKGDYGKLALIGGSKGMAGSITMSSMAALRTGSGLVYSCVPTSISRVVENKSLENIVWTFEGDNFSKANLPAFKERLKGIDALALGPGLGRSPASVDFVEGILELGIKGILDADGLYAASQRPSMVKDKDLVITPHHMEMARLVGEDVGYIIQNRREIAISTAKQYNIIVVLKGHNTIVTDGQRLYINKTGNAGMASGGSGDVLTGMIGSLIGQGYGLYEGAVLGVYLHGLAGDIAASRLGQDSLLARDIIASIPAAIRETRWEI